MTIKTTNMRRYLLAVLLAVVSPFFLLAAWYVRSAAVFVVSPDGGHPPPADNPVAQADAQFLVGVGRADITGPVVEINMMGYADPSQLGTGLRQRLYCRSFIVGSLDDAASRIAYLVLDIQSGDTAIRNGILEGLMALGKEFEVYTRHNGSAIAVTGTHSHAGPGAWLNYLLPQVTSKGFERSSYQAIVDGCILSMKRAHESTQPGRLHFGSHQLHDANINRSPYAYQANPRAERETYETDVDKTMSMLAFSDAAQTPLGVLTWFPVHGTSLYQNNTLIAGDNKGVAAYLLEKAMERTSPGFVAGFSQANVGDTTPNILGAFCEATGLPCRTNDSTCDGRPQGCHGRGPFYQQPDQGSRSCFEIGRRQFQAAKDLMDSPGLQPIKRSVVSSFHVFHNMANYTFISPFDSSKEVRTCSAALGHGFAGGTSDGPGAFDFRQGANDTSDAPSTKNPLWRVARAFVHPPTEDQVRCQRPKPILLDVGAATKPYAWTPNVVNIQMLRVGPILMVIAPGEATTMSGRRWRQAIRQQAVPGLGIDEAHVVIGGPSNTYAHYIATEEEYRVQRYEGASTLYGPHELEAYINLTLSYLPYLDAKKAASELAALPSGPAPPINTNRSLNFNQPVVVDYAGFRRSFGDVIGAEGFPHSFWPGDVVSVSFVGANPRNNLRLEGTFAAVEQFRPEVNAWMEVRTDRDWFLVYKWKRTSTILGTSEVSIEWEIEDDTPAGLYRVRYYGDAKSLGGDITPFQGTSSSFTVVR